MSSLFNLTAIGNLTADAAYKKAVNDRPYISFRLGVSVNNNGHIYTQYLSCQWWNPPMEQYGKMKKGALVYISGTPNIWIGPSTPQMTCNISMCWVLQDGIEPPGIDRFEEMKAARAQEEKNTIESPPSTEEVEEPKKETKAPPKRKKTPSK